jgi:hypothetical protein
MHLTLKRADGGVDRSQLSLQPIAPEGEGVQLALLVAAAELLGVGVVSAAKEWREHGKIDTS